MNMDNPSPSSTQAPVPLPPAVLEAATFDLRLARDRVLAQLNEEAQFRQAIYEATKDPALASQGSRLAAELARIDQDSPEGFNKEATVAAICGELGNRLHEADVCITEELYQLMTKEPGLPAWTHRAPDGTMFYLAKGWAIEKATGIDTRPLVCDPFLEAL